PCTVYACTKVFGEALARYYVDNFRMSMICIRICWFQGYDSEQLRTRTDLHREWCSPRDLAQLLLKRIAADLPFALLLGIPNNSVRYGDTRNAQQLGGYDPQDASIKPLAP